MGERGPSSRCAGLELRVLPGQVPQGLGEAVRDARDLQLLGVMAGRGDQPDVLEADREHVERPVLREQGEQGLHVEALVHHRELVDGGRQAVGAQGLRGAEDDQALAQLLPEGRVVHQLPDRRHQLGGLGALHAGFRQLLVDRAEQVLQPDRVLLRLRPGPDGRHVDRNAGFARQLEEVADLFAGDRGQAGRRFSGQQGHGHLLGLKRSLSPRPRRARRTVYRSSKGRAATIFFPPYTPISSTAPSRMIAGPEGRS